MENIFIHGLGQTDESFKETSSYFDEKCLCLNLKNLLNFKEVTFDNLYEVFCEYCDKFSVKLNLCGLSLGGMLALKYTIEHPDKVNSLVLIGVQYKIPKLIFNLQGMVFKFLPDSTFESTGFTKKDFITLTNSMKKLNFSNSLEKIKCNTLLICGEKDIANKGATIKLNKKIKNSQISIIPNAKHEVNIDCPKELYGEIINFYRNIIKKGE